MKIQILSDLHNEVRAARSLSLDIQETDADVIVLAGDIDLGTDGIRWAGEQGQRLNTPVVYVAGNHEFYHHEVETLRQELRHCAQAVGVHFLDNDALVIKGVRFLGTTLWTDYAVYAELDRATVMAGCARALPDHHLIRFGDAPFLPADALALHRSARAWLAEQLSIPFDGQTVVISHHGPSMACQHPRIPVNPVSAAFQSDLEDLLSLADLWIYGHTHSCLDQVVAGTRLVSNQLGYPKEGTGDFDGRKVVVLARS